MLASISAATLTGAVGQPVSVEVHVSNGLPGFTIVGLPDAAVRESRDRVRAALLSSGLPRATRGLSALDWSEMV
jgi:magnesium chelatase family protein